MVMGVTATMGFVLAHHLALGHDLLELRRLRLIRPALPSPPRLPPHLIAASEASFLSCRSLGKIIPYT